MIRRLPILLILAAIPASAQTIKIFASKPVPEAIAPEAISDLTDSTPTTSSCLLSWTAPHEDGASGGAVSFYDCRVRAGTTFVEGDFVGAMPLSGEPTPATPGSAESFTASGLSDTTDYAFACKSTDDVGNISAISNATTCLTTGASNTMSLMAWVNWEVGAATTSYTTGASECMKDSGMGTFVRDSSIGSISSGAALNGSYGLSGDTNASNDATYTSTHTGAITFLSGAQGVVMFNFEFFNSPDSNRPIFVTGTSVTTGVCGGGSNNGTSCTVDGTCTGGGVCAACRGGSNNGTACDADDDCTGGGTCGRKAGKVEVRAYSGGLFMRLTDGAASGHTADCSGVCSNGTYCSGGNLIVGNQYTALGEWYQGSPDHVKLTVYDRASGTQAGTCIVNENFVDFTPSLASSGYVTVGPQAFTTTSTVYEDNIAISTDQGQAATILTHRNDSTKPSGACQ